MIEAKRDKIITQTMEEVLHASMIPYAEYVIMDRAIPRVEDGLKPVQRRVLYTMFELGLTPDKPHKKSARIVGDCLGKFHPHSDKAVYDAMVRMAQNFNFRNTLVDGHGNFGSVDGDSAAAMRYTEARMHPLALELLRDIDKNTVTFSSNFDDSLLEPDMLPGRFPNLLVNGAYGIAVGLATNIPPHNLGEVIDGTILLIEKPSATLEDVMEKIKGPDFPTGGFIIKDSLKQAYTTGRGRIFIRAKVDIEEQDNGRKSIVISEMPYQVVKSNLLQKINVLKDVRPELQGIAEVVDESDKQGIRAVIRLKKDVDPKPLVEALFKRTDLQVSFNFNMVAIADGKPKTLGLLEILNYYIKYQVKVIVARTKYDLDEAAARAHVLEGLVIAVKNIDEVVEIIKRSKSPKEAKISLMDRFNLSEIQGQAILDMRLSRLTSMEIYKLEKELEELKKIIAHLESILSSKEKQLAVIKAELLEVKKNHGDERRSYIVESEEEINSLDENDDSSSKSVLILNGQNMLKRISKISFEKNKKAPTTLSDCHVLALEVEHADTLLAFSNLGNVFKLSPKSVPFLRHSEMGEKANTIISLDKNEKIVNILKFENDKDIIFLTKDGMAKKTLSEQYDMTKSSCVAIKLKDGDEVLRVDYEEEDKTIMFVSEKGMVLNATMTDIPRQNRVATGVKGINLDEGDKVIMSTQVGASGEILLISQKGYGKRVIAFSIDKMSRYRKGVKIFDLKPDDKIVFATYIKMPKDLVFTSDSDTTVISSEAFPIEKRETKGKIIEKVKFFQEIQGGQSHNT